MTSRCGPFCRDARPPAPGVAGRVARHLDRQGISPETMRVWLATSEFGVGRFADLCYSHAEAIATGLSKGILGDELDDLQTSEALKSSLRPRDGS